MLTPSDKSFASKVTMFADASTTLRTNEAELVPPSGPVAVKVYVVESCALAGIPEIAPVSGFIISAAGNDGETVNPVIGPLVFATTVVVIAEPS